jgi:signal peptidase I
LAYENQIAGKAHVLGCELAAEVADSFGRVRLRVAGTSMAPAIRPGDLLSVEPADPAELSPGEIVVFAREGRLIAHRLVGIGNGFLLTRGDRARRNDSPVSGAELVGRVTGIERGGSPVRPNTRLSLPEQVLCRVLRFSDRATYLYLRLAAL